MLTIISYFKMFAGVSGDEQQFQKIGAVLYSGMASRYVNEITVGGTLYLSNDKLIFQTNMLNFSYRHEWAVDLADIKRIEPDITFGMFNNGIMLTSQDNATERIIVHNREKWITAIDGALRSLPQAR